MSAILDPHETRAHWDHQAADYDQAKQRNDTYYRALKACFDRAIPVAMRGRILEVGCGTGQVLASLQPVAGVGIDLSPRMIAVAQREFSQRPELTFATLDAADAATLGPFDTVFSADVLEHVPDWQAVVTAMVQACRPGGLLAICTPNPWWALALWILEKLKLKMPEGPHRFVPIRAVAKHLRELGCDVVQLGTHLILPLRLFGLGAAFSRLAERLPILRHCGVIQLVVARKRETQHLNA